MTLPVRSNPIRLQRGGRRMVLRDQGHQSSKLYMTYEVDRWVRKIRPEESAKQGEKSCDWLVEICADMGADCAILEQVYVELKLKNDLEKALDQLSATIQRFDPNQRHKKRSYAVGKFSNPAQQRFRLMEKKLQKQYGSRFIVISGGATIPLYRPPQD